MIKTIILTLFLTVAAISSDISKALTTGDAKKLAANFNESVDLTILDDEGVYSKIQAEQIIKKFFNAHPIQKYEVVHVGNSKDGSAFEIGKLSSKTKVYRTYYVLKGNGAQQKIHQFRIEDDNE